MERNIEELNRQYWAKRILSFYWIMILVSFSGSVIAFIVTLQYYPDETLDYVLRHMIFPTVLQIVALGISEYLVKVKKIYNPYLLLTQLSQTEIGRYALI